MADYPGAVEAIINHLREGWTTTPIACANEPFQMPTDPSNGDLLPWCAIDVQATDSQLRGAGTPGDHVWITYGLIYVHVEVPINSGASLAQQYVHQIGELYRAAAFYNDGQGSIVRTWAPHAEGGGPDADNGNWYRLTMTCEFEFLFRG